MGNVSVKNNFFLKGQDSELSTAIAHLTNGTRNTMVNVDDTMMRESESKSMMEQLPY